MSYVFMIDKSKEVIFVTLDMLENEGQLWPLKKASGICRLIIKSIWNGTLAFVLTYWKVLALEIKYHPDTKASGESNWIGKFMQIRRLADGCQTKRKVLHERITHHCL